jgi:hypothetical protein
MGTAGQKREMGTTQVCISLSIGLLILMALPAQAYTTAVHVVNLHGTYDKTESLFNREADTCISIR